MTTNDDEKEKLRKRVQTVADETDLSFEEAALVILSWMAATYDDPAEVDALRMLRAFNPTFERMDN